MHNKHWAFIKFYVRPDCPNGWSKLIFYTVYRQVTLGKKNIKDTNSLLQRRSLYMIHIIFILKPFWEPLCSLWKHMQSCFSNHLFRIILSFVTCLCSMLGCLMSCALIHEYYLVLLQQCALCPRQKFKTQGQIYTGYAWQMICLCSYAVNWLIIFTAYIQLLDGCRVWNIQKLKLKLKRLLAVVPLVWRLLAGWQVSI